LKHKKVLVTGGASFIGSHLTDTLLKHGASVVVVDDLSSGRLENLEYRLKKVRKREWKHGEALVVKQGDVMDRKFLHSALDGCETVFHLAAVHGGRGFIDTHPADCCQNMAIDQMVIETCRQADVDRICFASSACVYPTALQEQTGSDYLLKEEDADPFEKGKANADLEYGWSKLMAEMALQAYHRQYGMKTASVRIFTAYGPRENETHAVIALIAKALIRADPYIIWGSGEQDRNFTYVQDIVDVMILASEKIEDGTPVNAGRSDRITLNQTAELVFDIMKWKPHEIVHDLKRPRGVASRAANLTRARSLLNWEPKVGYREGFQTTIKWYEQSHNATEVASKLGQLLDERTAQAIVMVHPNRKSRSV
jgi:nucleoside-diphosphate-sugar epimerase